MASANEWTLSPGTRISRKELQEEYGGRTQGGIGPSRKTPNVLIFSDPASGEQHGYFDGWQRDGCFHYTGEGQRGDQRMISGNRSILDHAGEGRALRLFQGARGDVEYVGEFALDDSKPWYRTDAPETGGGPLRSVIVFRLRPVDLEPAPPRSKLGDVVGAADDNDAVDEVSLEARNSERVFVDPSREPYEADRAEARLVESYADQLRNAGHEVCRLRIIPKGEYKPLFTDLYDKTAGCLVEAKGSTTREAVRMAIGQLVDYGRFRPEAKRVLLVPSELRADLAALAHAAEVEVAWPDENGNIAVPLDAPAAIGSA